MAIDLVLNIAPYRALQLLDEGIVGGSFTGIQLDLHTVEDGRGHTCIVVVYDKHYYRAGQRLTLTVTIEDLTGQTRLHAVGGGGGEGLFRFDWGASQAFAESPREILADYIIG